MSSMQYSRISGINKPVSRIVLGTGLDFASYEGVADGSLLDEYFELGVNAIDTALLYRGAEVLIGKWMKERGNREDVVIVTKGAHPGMDRRRVTPSDIESDVNEALKKMECDYLDAILLHRDDPDVKVGPIVDVLNKLRDEGKIHAFGGSNWSASRLAQANEYAYKHGLTPFTISSPQYALAEQIGDPWNMIPFADGCQSISGASHSSDRQWYLDNNVTVWGYAVLCRGFLSGKVKSINENRLIEERKGLNDNPPVFDPDSAPPPGIFATADSVDMVAKRAFFYPENFERLRRAEILANEKGVTVAQLSIAWLLNQPLAPFAVLATSKVEHMKKNIESFEIELTKSELDWLDLKCEVR